MALWVFVIAAAVGFVALPHIDIQGSSPISDGHFYWLMAQHPGTLYLVPHSEVGGTFAFRVLTPRVVSALPLRVETGFATLTVLSVAGCAAIVYLYARTFVERSAALRAVAFFAVAGGVLWLLLDPYLIDGLTMLFLILTFLLVRRGYLGWATVTMCAGVANHEVVLLALPVLVVAYLIENGKLAARVVPFMVLPILVFAVIHYTPVIYGHIPPSQPVGIERWKEVLHERAFGDGGLKNSVLFAVSSSFGGIWLLALLGLRGASRFLRATAVMIPLIVCVLLVVGDWVRYLTFVFPIVVVLACRVRIRWSVFIALVAVQITIGVLALNRIEGTYINDFGSRYTSATLLLFSLSIALILCDRLFPPRAAERPADNDRAGGTRPIDAAVTPIPRSSVIRAQKVLIPGGLLIAAVTAALAVTGVASFSINDFRTAKEPATAQTKTHKPSGGPLSGRVKAVARDLITSRNGNDLIYTLVTITGSNLKDLYIFTTSTTITNKASAGTFGDITPGSTILVQGKRTHVGIDADNGEVLVLPADSNFGSTAGPIGGRVKAVHQHAITITRFNGTELRVKITALTIINKASAGTVGDITPGSTVLVQAKRTYVGIDADKGEILVLPADSKFETTGA